MASCACLLSLCGWVFHSHGCLEEYLLELCVCTFRRGLQGLHILVVSICVFYGEMGFCAYTGDGTIVSMFQRCVISLSVSIHGCES